MGCETHKLIQHKVCPFLSSTISASVKYGFFECFKIAMIIISQVQELCSLSL